MLEEALDLLNVGAGQRYLDATVGLGGHAEAVLKASDPDGQLLGTDADPNALAQNGKSAESIRGSCAVATRLARRCTANGNGCRIDAVRRSAL